MTLARPRAVTLLLACCFIIVSASGPATALTQDDAGSPIVEELDGFAAAPLETVDIRDNPDGAVERSWRRTFETDLAFVQIDAEQYGSAEDARAGIAGAMFEQQERLDLDPYAAHETEASVVVGEGFADGIPVRVAFYREGDIGYTIMLISGAVIVDFDEVVAIQLAHSTGERGALHPDEPERLLAANTGTGETADDESQASALVGQILMVLVVASGFAYMVRRRNRAT